MKTIFNPIRYGALSAVISLQLIAPLAVLAQTPPAPNSRMMKDDAMKMEMMKNFCARITEHTTKFDQKMGEREATLKEKRDERATNWEARWKKHDEELAAHRAQWDANRAEQFAKKEARATTDAEKQAVMAFKTAMTTAISARRAAVDSAIKTFREGFQKVMAARKDAINAAVQSFKTAEKAAFDKAKADCAAGIAPKTIRDTLHASLKTARDKFAQDRRAIDKLQSSLDPLIAARKTAIQKAISDFKTAAEKARTDLKKVLDDQK